MEHGSDDVDDDGDNDYDGNDGDYVDGDEDDDYKYYDDHDNDLLFSLPVPQSNLPLRITSEELVVGSVNLRGGRQVYLPD